MDILKKREKIQEEVAAPVEIRSHSALSNVIIEDTDVSTKAIAVCYQRIRGETPSITLVQPPADREFRPLGSLIIRSPEQDLTMAQWPIDVEKGDVTPPMGLPRIEVQEVAEGFRIIFDGMEFPAKIDEFSFVHDTESQPIPELMLKIPVGAVKITGNAVVHVKASRPVFWDGGA